MNKRKLPKIEISNCVKCKREIVIDIPFIAKDIHGYKSVEHECGPNYVQYIFMDNGEILNIKNGRQQLATMRIMKKEEKEDM